MTDPADKPTTEVGQFLRRADAAAYIRAKYAIPCSRQLLAKLAVVGGGPVYRRAGRFPIYEARELDRWALARFGPSQRSTSDAPRRDESPSPETTCRPVAGSTASGPKGGLATKEHRTAEDGS